MQYRTFDVDRPDFAAWHYTAPGSNRRVNATLALLPADPATPDAPRAWRYTVSLDNPATPAPARIWSEGVHRGTRSAAIYYTNQIALKLRVNKVLHGSRHASRRTAREGSAARWTAEASRNADAAALARIHEVWRAVPDGPLSARDAIQRIGAILADARKPAPARNCDRFSGAEQAFSAFFQQENILAKIKERENDCTPEKLRFALACCFADWLFAPAEGGAR